MKPSNRTVIRVHQPILKPKFTNIGFGNPRYNSLIVCPDDTVIVPCGTSLRKVDIVNDAIIKSKQVGWSQIFQVLENQKWIMVVNFQGLVSLLDKKELNIEKQFYASGKEIRHSAISTNYIALSCELNDGTKEACLEIYAIADILATEGIEIKAKPKYHKMGYYYYPEIVKDQLIFIEFDDPNPKGRSRTETVLNKKLPVKHKILKKNLNNLAEETSEIYNIKTEGQILCACQNLLTKQIFYLHEAKKLTILDLSTLKGYQMVIATSAAPHCIEPYKNGILYASLGSELTYLTHLEEKVNTQIIKLKIKGLTTSYSIKLSGENFIFFNENGLEYYKIDTHKIFTQNCFDITNCGISFNSDASKFVVADFGGNVYIFSTNQNNMIPQAISKVLIGIPVRSLAWCHDTNKIVIGCVGGYLFDWDGQSQEGNMICQTNDHTVNIVRYYSGFVIFGTSDGFVHIMESSTLEEFYRFQAHFPIHYENQKDKELFGSMKNYAEIWSIIAYPGQKQNTFYLVTSSQDQSQKVFLIESSETDKFSHKQEHHLVGHSLAVTSIDWKHMGKGLGPVYVSCSDDKVVRFRNPSNMFEILHQLETSTIKEWHTLTYLALQPNGHRVAIGSQNGYLFIFDILTKQLLYGQKIHLGGVEGMDWLNGKLITCSSDLCISIAYL